MSWDASPAAGNQDLQSGNSSGGFLPVCLEGHLAPFLDPIFAAVSAFSAGVTRGRQARARC